MSAVNRLVTFVGIDDQADDDTISVSARHEAELEDGSQVLLLNDRGWGASGPANIWAYTSVQDIVRTARMVVGPDEPFGGRSQEDMEADHWASLQRIAQRQGVVTDAAELRQLPHDVVLSPQLLARIHASASDACRTAVPDADRLPEHTSARCCERISAFVVASRVRHPSLLAPSPSRREMPSVPGCDSGAAPVTR